MHWHFETVAVRFPRLGLAFGVRRSQSRDTSLSGRSRPPVRVHPIKGLAVNFGPTASQVQR
jgi:hypothetical protein